MTVGTGSLQEGGEKSDSSELQRRERSERESREVRSDPTTNRCSTVAPGCQRADRAEVLKWLQTYLNVTEEIFVIAPNHCQRPAPRPQTGSTPLSPPPLQAWKMTLTVTSIWQK